VFRDQDEAVAATRALCGYRLVNWGRAKPADLFAPPVQYTLEESTTGFGATLLSAKATDRARRTARRLRAKIHCVEVRLISSEARWQTHRVRDDLRGVAAQTVE
jgi:hypothetical protein